MIATTITVAISLFIGLLAAAALLSTAVSIRRGIASGRATLRELALIEAGYRPSSPARTLPASRKVSRQRPRVRPAPAPLAWLQHAAA